MIKRFRIYWPLIVPVVFILLFFVTPLLGIFYQGLVQGKENITRVLFTVVRDHYYQRVIVFTFWQAFLSTCGAVVVGLPGAYVLAKYEFKGKNLWERLVALPFMLPTVVVGLSFSVLLGPSLFAQFRGSLTLVVLAHIYYNLSLTTRIVSKRWESLEPDFGQAARVLGAGRLQRFVRVDLPLLLPSILAAAVLTFLFCFISFAVVLFLGPVDITTAEVEIYRQAIVYFDLGKALILSSLQLCFVVFLNWLYVSLQKKNRVQSSDIIIAKRPLATARRIKQILLGFYLAGILLFLAAPLIVLVWRSFTACSADNIWACYESLFINKTGSIFFLNPLKAVFNTLYYAILTCLFSLSLALIVVFVFMRNKNTLFSFRTNRGAGVILLPLGVSSVTLGLGYVSSQIFNYLGLGGSSLLVVAAHTVIAFPFVLMVVLPRLRSIPDQIFQAALVMGARDHQVMKSVILPIIKPTLKVAAVYALLVSMGEFGATLLLAKPENATLPVMIRKYFSLPGNENYGKALALSSILLLITIVLMSLAESDDSRDF